MPALLSLALTGALTLLGTLLPGLAVTLCAPVALVTFALWAWQGVRTRRRRIYRRVYGR